MPVLRIADESVVELQAARGVLSRRHSQTDRLLTILEQHALPASLVIGILLVAWLLEVVAQPAISLPAILAAAFHFASTSEIC